LLRNPNWISNAEETTQTRMATGKPVLSGPSEAGSVSQRKLPTACPRQPEIKSLNAALNKGDEA